MLDNHAEAGEGGGSQTRSDMTVAVAVGVSFALIYVGLAARHLLGGDAGEFALIAGVGGYAHPPGYPLYSIFLSLVGRLPVSSAAHEAAMATALIGAVATGVLYLACRRWGASRMGALFGVVVFGLALALLYDSVHDTKSGIRNEE